MERFVFRRANIITEHGIFTGDLLVEGSKISQIGTVSTYCSNEIDAEGLYLSPGFIDIHTHGAGNADFMDGDVESMYCACRTHLAHGTTSIVPTTVAGSQESLLSYVELFNQVELNKPGLPNILGLHIEGPYFAGEYCGAQNPAYLRNPDPAEYLSILEKTDRIIRWSFAVELPGAGQFLETLRKNRINCSLAHSAATCSEVEEAMLHGLNTLTHFYSAMTTVQRINAYRVAGAIEAGYLFDDLFVEVIADGKHLPDELLKLIYKIKGPKRICLVTDSMRAAGMPDGNYILGGKHQGLPVIVEDDVAKLPDRSAFAGSTATADRLVKTFMDLTGTPLHETIRMITLTPAELLTIDDRKGSIKIGKDADLLLFDSNISIQGVMVMGNMEKWP